MDRFNITDPAGSKEVKLFKITCTAQEGEYVPVRRGGVEGNIFTGALSTGTRTSDSPGGVIILLYHYK